MVNQHPETVEAPTFDEVPDAPAACVDGLTLEAAEPSGPRPPGFGEQSVALVEGARMLLWRPVRVRGREAGRARSRLRSSVAGPGNLTLAAAAAAAAASASGSPARRQIITASAFSGVISKKSRPEGEPRRRPRQLP